MKKLVVGLVAVLLLAGCSEEETKEAKKTEEVVTTEDAKEKATEDSTTKEVEEKTTEDSTNKETEEQAIKEKSEDNGDTILFADTGAEEVKVTDEIKTKEQATAVIQIEPDVQAGAAVVNVVNKMYDFLQQEKLTDAKKVIVIVKQKDKRVAQFTVNTTKFDTKDGKWASDAVMDATKIDFMTDEVKEYGKLLEVW